MKKLSIKKINRFIYLDKPKSIARYLQRFIPLEKQSLAEVRLDEYAHKLIKDEGAEKSKVLKKIEELKNVRH